MKSAAELLASQAKPLCTVAPEATVFEALHILAKNEVGALAVVDPQGKLMGIISERDYTRKVALQGKNSREALVAEIMTREVLVVNTKTRARECMALMSSRKIRHLPVVDGDQLIGVLSIRDLLDAIIADQKQTIEQLESYIHS
jgi:CBS domain-containing protein